jgi:hypothetical protein
MSARLDLVLQKFPDHEGGIHLLAARDPSGNLKYLDWGAKMLAAGQALAPEVADVLDLFHRFNGQWVGGQQGRRRRTRHTNLRDRIRPDLYTYRPQDFAILRDALFKIKRAQDKKRRERERLYRIEGSVEAAVVYDSPDLIVRHIQNKQASVHYGGSTKWCISMLREEYFDDYEAHNATFFFFERKTSKGDEFDKVALMIPRCNGGSGYEETLEVFDSLDRRIDMLVLVRVHGVRIFNIFREVYERSEQYPGSAMFHVYAGSATSEQLEAVAANLAKGAMSPYEIGSMLESICCNDATPPALLEWITREAVALFTRACKSHKHYRRRMPQRRNRVKELWRAIAAALVIHPQTAAGLRETLTKDLRRRHVRIDQIHRENDRSGRIGVTYQSSRSRDVSVFGRGRSFRRYRRRETVSGLEARVRGLVRMTVRARKRLKLVKQKQAKKKKRKAGR